ncbi:class I SAM-dependent methyltransferase [Selenomonas sp. TAMA-11512]|uniref:class I SAM-dependent methyltransferase n=1 Tax=Selenomonas sp. TAMA-11512 TaxID=3095337 RepID=UPI0030937E78|nr:class I SAM-dependent methyltransferase [Selenomonas sp. TAMA-11512]
MPMLGTVESTLFVPMLGRIYASENFPRILYDPAALALKGKLPEEVTSGDTQSQYTYLASASRSANMDRCIKDFLARRPEGVVVQLGCGIETAFQRCDNGGTKWYDVDLPHVIAYRKTLLPESDREIYIASDAFSDAWITRIRREIGDVPLLVTAGGLFYYFEESRVLALLTMLRAYGSIELVFDAVHERGMRMMRKTWMKKVGHADAKMFFFVNSAAELASKAGRGITVLSEEAYYSRIDKSGLSLTTKATMVISDLFRMVKMIHLRLDQ